MLLPSLLSVVCMLRTRQESLSLIIQLFSDSLSTVRVSPLFSHTSLNSTPFSPLSLMFSVSFHPRLSVFHPLPPLSPNLEETQHPLGFDMQWVCLPPPPILSSHVRKTCRQSNVTFDHPRSWVPERVWWLGVGGEGKEKKGRVMSVLLTAVGERSTFKT